MNQVVRRLSRLLLLTLAGLVISHTAGATVFKFKVLNYSMDNGGSANGSAGSPHYCFRADEVAGLGDSATFSCEGPGTGVQLEYNDNDTPLNDSDDLIHIHGTMFGGTDAGASYDPNESGYVEIDFTYADNIFLAPAIDVEVDPESRLPELNTGELTFANDLTWQALGIDSHTVALVDEDGGKEFSFKFNNHDDSKGCGLILCLDPTLWHGWGWVNYDDMIPVPDADFPDNHVSASDWLFIAQQEVPEPGTVALLGAGLFALGWRRRCGATSKNFSS